MKFLQSLAQHFAGKPIDWDELEESLIRADLGVPMTSRIMKTLQERESRPQSPRIMTSSKSPAKRSAASYHDRQSLRPFAYARTEGNPDRRRQRNWKDNLHQRQAGRLSREDRHTVLLAAADTFRAAAIEQLGSGPSGSASR